MECPDLGKLLNSMLGAFGSILAVCTRLRYMHEFALQTSPRLPVFYYFEYKTGRMAGIVHGDVLMRIRETTLLLTCYSNLLKDPNPSEQFHRVIAGRTLHASMDENMEDAPPVLIEAVVEPMDGGAISL